MARVTVEDCVDKVPNRFELVLLAAHRARAVSAGAEITIDRDNDKNPVVALREIADETIIPAEVREELVTSMQKRADRDEPELEPMALIGNAPEQPAASGGFGGASAESDTSLADSVFGSPAGGTAPDAPDTLDQMSEADLLRALQSQMDTPQK